MSEAAQSVSQTAADSSPPMIAPEIVTHAEAALAAARRAHQGHVAKLGAQEKLVAMRAGVGDRALALASGVTPENVSAYLPHVDAFLVASGIESRFGVFDTARMKDLADQIHAWRAP